MDTIVDPFGKHLGATIIEVKEGYAKAYLKIEEYHLNSHGILHGGAIFSLADFVFALASNSYPETKAVALQANIQYLNSIREGIIYAEAKENYKSEKIGSYSIKVFTENKLIALFDGIVYRKKKMD